jgi:hypothetical protein
MSRPDRQAFQDVPAALAAAPGPRLSLLTAADHLGRSRPALADYIFL